MIPARSEAALRTSSIIEGMRLATLSLVIPAVIQAAIADIVGHIGLLMDWEFEKSLGHEALAGLVTALTGSARAAERCLSSELNRSPGTYDVYKCETFDRP